AGSLASSTPSWTYLPFDMLKNTGTPGPGSTGSKNHQLAGQTGRGQLAEAKVESGSTSPRRGSTGRAAGQLVDMLRPTDG
ncbi:hypothetical protein HRR83_009589, partial [Exophiala dermatitidis]